MPLANVRGRSAAVATKRVIAGDLLGRQQRALRQVNFEMNGAKLALQGSKRIDSGSKLRRSDRAVNEGLVEIAFSLNDLDADGLRSIAHPRIERFCCGALRVGEVKLARQLKHVQRPRIGIELCGLCQTHAAGFLEVADVLVRKRLDRALLLAGVRRCGLRL